MLVSASTKAVCGARPRRRGRRIAGEGVEAPTTTINVDAMSIVTLRDVEFMDSPARFSELCPILSVTHPDHSSGRSFRIFGS
ncbi:uncharacterized protein ARMOST_20219 [Armillaria ostoyae]|uniref:Uncharacterized protein n=1 Tax=Armillaria ostoyae TaxID=47428 RepID=A0A284S6R1_ARMOS|nr:uncharacterized protein ARMOST_20219 [Armillaria ostoyae]